VSEPTYTITITESERTALSRVLGLLVTKLTSAPVFVEAASGGTAHARAVLAPAPPAAAPGPTPIEPRDRWARDRKGNELANPEGCAAREVTIWKTEQKPGKKDKAKTFLKVTWQSQERGYVDANCFDSQLFPWLINQAGKKTTLYLVKSGEYLNVAGLRV
jgi:hypothetical protein